MPRFKTGCIEFYSALLVQSPREREYKLILSMRFKILWKIQSLRGLNSFRVFVFYSTVVLESPRAAHCFWRLSAWLSWIHPNSKASFLDCRRDALVVFITFRNIYMVTHNSLFSSVFSFFFFLFMRILPFTMRKVKQGNRCPDGKENYY